MKNETVILLHGITRGLFHNITGGPIDMIPLKTRLGKEGYACINMKYPSTEHKISDLSQIIHNRLKNDARYTDADKVHFVGHSMGGLVTRYIMAQNRPDNLGSVVMMGTPNKGSQMADFAAKHKFLTPVFNFFFGPAGQELRTDHKHFENEVIDYPLGIIASNISLNPLANRVFGVPNDMLVSVENTKLEGMEDHIVIPSTHLLMPYDNDIIGQVSTFLKYGAFNHDYNINRRRTYNLEQNLPDGPAFQ